MVQFVKKEAKTSFTLLKLSKEQEEAEVKEAEVGLHFLCKSVPAHTNAISGTLHLPSDACVCCRDWSSPRP